MEVNGSLLARGYSRSAADYDELAGHLYLTGIRRLLPLLRLPPKPSILDVGCGTGINLIEAARWFSPVGLLAGIDIAEGMVRLTQAKAFSLRLPALITQGDAQRLPYPDRCFDLVICNSVLHWFTDRQAAVREISRVLRPGGQIALICAAHPGFQEWFMFIEQLLRVLGIDRVPTAPPLPTGTEVASLFWQSELRPLYLNHLIRRDLVPNHAAFVRIMSTVAPYWCDRLTQEEQARVEHLATAWLRQRFPYGFPSTWATVESVAAKAISI